jgi:integrase
MPLKLKKRGEIWQYTGTVAGIRLRGSTKTSQRSEAEKEANRIERAYLDRDRYGPGETLTFAQAAYEYRKVRGEPRHLVRVEDYWRDTLVKNITNGAVKRAAFEIMPASKPASRNRAVLAPTMAVINFAASMDLCPRLKVDRFAVVKPRREPATWEWVKAFMAHSSPHLGGLACFMFLTGARVGEALEVRWKDVDLKAATAVIKMGKIGGEERIAHLPAALVVAIANIPGERKPGGKVFFYANSKTMQQPWATATKRAGIAPLGRHACRHGFATGLLHAGVDPVTVAERGGWKTPALVFSTYGHPQANKKVADLLTGIPQAHEELDDTQVSDKIA